MKIIPFLHVTKELMIEIKITRLLIENHKKLKIQNRLNIAVIFDSARCILKI